jgi:hypothetical protein
MADLTLIGAFIAIISITITSLAYFIRYGRELEKECEKIIQLKLSALDEYFLEIVIPFLITGLFRNLQSKRKEMHLEEQDISKITLGQIIGGTIGRKLVGPDDLLSNDWWANRGKEFYRLFEMPDEDKEEIEGTVSIIISLKYIIPELISGTVDKFFKAIQIGILLGILGGVYFIIPPDLSVLSTILQWIIVIVLALLFYVLILEMPKLRKMEKKLREIKNEPDVSNLSDIVQDLLN